MNPAGSPHGRATTGTPLRTLFITTKPVFPPAGGAAIRNWRNMLAMQRHGPVGVIAITRDRVDAQDLTGFALHRSYSPQDYPRTIARAVWLWSGRFSSTGHPIVRRNALPQIARAVQRDMAAFKPDLVVFEELWVMHYVAHARALGAVCVLDNHNVEAPLRASSGGVDKGRRDRRRNRRSDRQTQAVERSFVASVDRVWVCSQNDRDLISSIYHLPVAPAVIPNVVDLAYYREVRESHATLKPDVHQVAYVGTFSYPPNEAAALTLMRDVMPVLRARHKDATLVLVGADPTQDMRSVALGLDWVTVTGSVSDVRPYLQAASVVAVPLLRGSGTRIKILEAFACALPVVSSRIGADGLDVVDGEHVLLADEAGGMATAISRIWDDAAVARSLVAAGYALVERDYSAPVAQRAVDAAVADLFPTRAAPAV